MTILSSVHCRHSTLTTNEYNHATKIRITYYVEETERDPLRRVEGLVGGKGSIFVHHQRIVTLLSDDFFTTKAGLRRHVTEMHHFTSWTFLFDIPKNAGLTFRSLQDLYERQNFCLMAKVGGAHYTQEQILHSNLRYFRNKSSDIFVLLKNAA